MYRRCWVDIAIRLTDHADRLAFFWSQKAQGEPAKDIIHDRFCMWDIWILRWTGWFVLCVSKLVHENFERYAVLKTDRDGGRKRINHASDSATLFCEADEDFAWLAIFVETNSNIALTWTDLKFVGDGFAFVL